MGLFSSLGKVARLASKVTNSPLGKVASMVPGLGTVVGAVGMAGTAYSAVKAGQALLRGGGSSAQLPALPGGSLAGGQTYGLPALPGSAGAPPIVGKRSVFRDDPNIAEALKAWAISQRFLRQSFRSPMKGYVIVRDSVGDPYALPKAMAIKYAGYRPAKKPPISVGEWQSLKRADRTVKKVRKVVAMMSRVDKAVGKGGKVKVKKGGSK